MTGIWHLTQILWMLIIYLSLVSLLGFVGFFSFQVPFWIFSFDIWRGEYFTVMLCSLDFCREFMVAWRRSFYLVLLPSYSAQVISVSKLLPLSSWTKTCEKWVDGLSSVTSRQPSSSEEPHLFGINAHPCWQSQQKSQELDWQKTKLYPWRWSFQARDQTYTVWSIPSCFYGFSSRFHAP